MNYYVDKDNQIILKYGVLAVIVLVLHLEKAFLLTTRHFRPYYLIEVTDS